MTDAIAQSSSPHSGGQELDKSQRDTQTKPQRDSVSQEPRPAPGELFFQLKASRLTLTQLELFDAEKDGFDQQMSKILTQAPHFFEQTPVIITLDKVRDPEKKIDFVYLMHLCQVYGVYPIAVRGGTEEMQISALAAGLPSLPPASSSAKEDEAAQKDAVPKAAAQNRPTKIIRKPVRSGQQIYARGTDLILLGPVSTGAEVLADGNIHCYAALRGRALAGTNGNTDAHIFCQQLEAELISIAGNYKLCDDLQGPNWGKAIHASLHEQGMVLRKL